MEYYILRNSSESKKIGIYPQTDGMSPGYDFESLDSVYNIPIDEFPSIEPNFNYFVLDKRAKITDVISTGLIPIGFLLNDKVKNILTNYKLMPHIFFNATIKANNDFLYNYYWLHLVSDIEKYVDFPKMSFYKMDFFGSIIEDETIKLKNFNELIQLREKVLNEDIGHAVRSPNLILREFDLSIDLFQVSLLSPDIYISKRLKNRLEYEEVSGIIIKEIEDNFLMWS